MIKQKEKIMSNERTKIYQKGKYLSTRRKSINEREKLISERRTTDAMIAHFRDAMRAHFCAISHMNCAITHLNMRSSHRDCAISQRKCARLCDVCEHRLWRTMSHIFGAIIAPKMCEIVRHRTVNVRYVRASLNTHKYMR